MASSAKDSLPSGMDSLQVVGPAPVPQGWTVDPERADVREILPGLWCLRLPLAWREVPHVNVFALAREGGGVVLVDAAMAGAGAWEALTSSLRRAGGSVRDVQVLAITHAHADHVGLAARVVEESACEVWMHPGAEAFFSIVRDPGATESARARRARLEGVPEALIGAHASVEEEAGGTLGPVELHRALVAGASLPTALGDWHVVETPGHAPSHVCLHQPERRLLIVGDLLSRGFAPFFDYGFSDDPIAEYLASLDAVAELEVELVLPGHGAPLRDFGGLIAAHRAGVHDRLAAVRAGLAPGPATGYELTRRIFGRPPSVVAGVWQLAEVVAYLGHLRRVGDVERSEADGVYAYALA
jgi:glyoxylase-like metal-dependent hydrolase (beta-lactamase superfamily II)